MRKSQQDPRRFSSGYPIPKEGYCDQPYVVINTDGSWVCVMTTGSGIEGQHGQHVVSTTSSDFGKTWSEPIDIEPADGPEASWVMPFLVPESGRIYAFYVYNKDNLRAVISNEGPIRRVDTLGGFFFRYSDDGGRSWSGKRYEIPVRPFQWDRENPYEGKILFFWGVGKPILHRGAMYMGFAKVGNFGDGFMYRSEGAFIRSASILTETDPEKLVFDTLPEGDVGLRAPEDRVADEHNPVGLADGGLYCTYRTLEGYNAHAYSRDEGRTWTAPEHAVYTPGGRRIKHPRAANFVKKVSGGRYLLWYHNNGTRWYSNGASAGNRNVGWIAGGREVKGCILWSEPEILLFTEDQLLGPSYPDLVEDQGRFFILATQKKEARVMEIERRLLEDLWRQYEISELAEKGLVLDLDREAITPGLEIPAPELPEIRGVYDQETRSFIPRCGEGFTLDFWIRFDGMAAHRTIVTNQNKSGIGFALKTTERGSVRIDLCDGWMGGFWECDSGLFETGRDHHCVVIVDGSARVISFVVDGRLCDGGPDRPFGWGRLSPYFRSVKGADLITVAPDLDGELLGLRLYNRSLRTTEAIGNFRFGLQRQARTDLSNPRM